MEKICEFCGAPRPVVYCEADAAFLCLSCDAKVHSANALSGRHSRTLVCDLCRETPAHVRCLDHLMLMCRGCEIRLHQSFPLHRKHIMSSFTGCPSSKHFAALWGFGGGDHSGRGSNLIGSEPCVAKDLNGVKLRSLGSSTQHKTLMNHREEQKGNLIKQQIVELEKLEIQLSEGNNNRSSLSNRRVNPITSSSTYTASGKLDEGLGIRHSKEVKFCISNHLQSLENPSQESKGERFPSSISQLDQLSCSSSVGDPFWQYKSPVDNSQFWSQNLQDLGVCEDLGSLDDLNIPDVDVTFRNFDDLFTTDLDLTRALLEDDDMSFSDIQRGNRHSKTTEDGSSISMSKDMNSKNKGSASDHHHHHHMMRFASFSRSRLSAESSGSECVNSGHSVPICTPRVQGREALHKDINKTRMHGKQAQLAPRKAKGEMNKRIKGRSMSFGGYDSDTMNITNSY